MQMLARRRRAGKKGSKTLEEEIRGAGDLVGAGGEIGDRGADLREWKSRKTVGRHDIGFTANLEARRQARNDPGDRFDRLQWCDDPCGELMEKVGLEVDDQLVFRFQAMDPKSCHDQNCRYLASGRPCLAT